MIPFKYNCIFEEIDHLSCDHASNSAYRNLQTIDFCLSIKKKIRTVKSHSNLSSVYIRATWYLVVHKPAWGVTKSHSNNF